MAEALIDHGADTEGTAACPGIPYGTPPDSAVHLAVVDVFALFVAR